MVGGIITICCLNSKEITINRCLGRWGYGAGFALRFLPLIDRLVKPVSSGQKDNHLSREKSLRKRSAAEPPDLSRTIFSFLSFFFWVFRIVFKVLPWVLRRCADLPLLKTVSNSTKNAAIPKNILPSFDFRNANIMLAKLPTRWLQRMPTAKRSQYGLLVSSTKLFRKPPDNHTRGYCDS